MSATTKPTTLATKTTCPDCGLPQISNGQITWCEKGHVYKARKTTLIRSTPQSDGECRSCRAKIVWVMTEKGRWTPMNPGFDVVERIGALGTLLRVYQDQNHFATCPNARRHRKGGRHVGAHN